MIELALPSSGEVGFDLSQDPECLYADADLPEPIECEAVEESGMVRIRWYPTFEIPRLSFQQFSVENGFINPISAEETESFEMRIWQDAIFDTVVD